MMRVSTDWLRGTIDRWRLAHPDSLSRAEAIRRLVDAGLNSEGGLARTIDGRRASVGKIGKVEVTVFDDGEVRVVTRHRS